MDYRIRDLTTSVPLDHDDPSGERIDVFCREVSRPECADAPVCVFLQGGPGVESPRDLDGVAWLAALTQRFRVLLLDQRGTGRSTPVEPELVERVPDGPDLAAYLQHFRADSIVRDLEIVRREHYGGEPWYLLGQSFGGFTACHYLSAAPEGLLGAIITGGLAPLTTASPDEVYDAVVANVHAHSMAYYRRYPEDATVMRRLVDRLRERPEPLDDGGRLTARRLLDLGMLLGATGGPSRLHALLDDPFIDRAGKRLRWSFVERVRRESHYETNPLFVLLQEAVYCDGTASHWAAQRAMERHGGFSLDAGHIAFHGETMQPSMLEDYARLQPYARAGRALAEVSWPALYDHDRLANNRIPVEAIAYEQDFYVDAGLSARTAEAIGGCRVWWHPEWAHDGLRRYGDEVVAPLLERLLQRVSTR